MLELFAGVVTATILILIGMFVGRRTMSSTTTETKENELFCGYADVKKTTEDDGWRYNVHPCDGIAVVIKGGTSYCQDCYDVYLVEMTGVCEN